MNLNKQSLLVGAFLFFISGAIAYFLPGNVLPAKNSSSRGEFSHKLTATKSAPRNQGGNDVARMKSILQLKSDKERTRAAIELASTIPLSDATKWLDGTFQIRDGYAYNAFWATLRNRWQIEDPEGHDLWALRTGKNVTPERLAALAHSQPEKLSALFAKQPSHQVADRLAGLAKADPEFFLDFLEKNFAAFNLQSYHFQETFLSLVKANPELLRAKLDELSADLKSGAQAALYTADFGKDFDGTLQEILTIPGGYSQLRLARKIIGKNPELLLSKLTELPPSWLREIARSPSSYFNQNYSALLDYDWSQTALSPNEISDIHRNLLRSLSYGSPLKAAQYLDKLPLTPDHRKKALEYVLDKLKEGRPAQREKILAGITNPEDLAFLNEQLAEAEQPPGEEPPLQANELKNTEQLLEYFNTATLDPKKLYRTSLNFYLGQWGPKQKAELGRQFPSLDPSQKTLIAGVVMSGRDNFDTELADAALDYLLKNESAREELGWNDNQLTSTLSSYAIDLLLRDSQAATQWVEELPEGDMRLWTKKNMAANWFRQDPIHAENWLKSQPSKSQEAIREFLDKN